MIIGFSFVRFTILFFYLAAFCLLLNKEKGWGGSLKNIVQSSALLQRSGYKRIITNVKLFKLNKKATLKAAPMVTAEPKKSKTKAMKAHYSRLPSNITPEFAAKKKALAINYSQEIANILENHWVIPFFLKDKVYLEAVFNLKLNSSGKIIEVIVVKQSPGQEGQIYAESARKSINAVGSFNFPKSDYEKWNTLTVRFAHERIGQ